VPADPLTELRALLHQARREVVTSVGGDRCWPDRLEIVHRLTRCARRMGWPPDPLRKA